MKKRILCLVLAVAAMLTLCACGAGGRYKVVKSVKELEYSIALRNGDVTYHYIDAALKELSYDGTVDSLSAKWFGSSSAVDFPKSKNAISKLGYIEQRTFTIGADPNSFPLCYESGGSYEGFDVELARAVCNKLGWQLIVQPIQSVNAYVELNSGNIDCAWGGVALDTESADYTILSTYMDDELVIAARGNGKSFLTGGTLYVGPDQMYMDIINENPSIANRVGQITRVSGTLSDYLAYLDKGECDFVIITKSTVKYYR